MFCILLQITIFEDTRICERISTYSGPLAQTAADFRRAQGVVVKNLFLIFASVLGVEMINFAMKKYLLYKQDFFLLLANVQLAIKRMTDVKLHVYTYVSYSPLSTSTIVAMDMDDNFSKFNEKLFMEVPIIFFSIFNSAQNVSLSKFGGGGWFKKNECLNILAHGLKL